MPSWVAAIESSSFPIASRTEIAPKRPCSTSSSTRVQRTVTSENSAATKNPLSATSTNTMAMLKTSTTYGMAVPPLLDVAAPLEGPRERHLVGVLEITSHGHAAGDARDAHPERREELGQIERGGFAVHVGVGGEDDLLHLAAAQAREQLADPELFRARALQRRERAAQHVVAARELAGALEREHVHGLLDHAQHARVTTRVAAQRARVGLREVAARAAEAHPLAHRADRLGQP